MVDIYEIAARCGVSIATVSRVINGSPRVNSATKEKVLSVIKETGFVPNAFARGLNFNSIGLIGVLCTDFGDAFFSQAVSYIEKNLRKNDLNAMLVCTGYTLEGKKKGLEQLVNKNVDAIVLIGAVFKEEHNEHIAEVAKKIPVFTVNSSMDYPNVYSVKCDERQAIREVVAVLTNKGYRMPLYLYENPLYGNAEKIEGFREGLLDAGIQPEDEMLVSLGQTSKKVVPLIRDYILTHKESIDAVLTSNDALAIYTVKAMRGLGVKFPVVGFNNSSVAEMATPELTSVDNMLEEMCRITVDNLTDVLAGKRKPSQITVLTGRLVHRETF